MPRGKQGGKRQGTPGKAYSNRTDLMQNYNMEAGTPAAGPVNAGQSWTRPDDLPSLDTPTKYPDQPITSGLNMGAGNPAQPGFDSMAERKQLQRYLPLLEPYLTQPDTPQSVKMLFRYIRGAG